MKSTTGMRRLLNSLQAVSQIAGGFLFKTSEYRLKKEECKNDMQSLEGRSNTCFYNFYFSSIKRLKRGQKNDFDEEFRALQQSVGGFFHSMKEKVNIIEDYSRAMENTIQAHSSDLTDLVNQGRFILEYQSTLGLMKHLPNLLNKLPITKRKKAVQEITKLLNDMLDCSEKDS